MADGITKLGEFAEKLFCELVAGAERAEKKDGDIWLNGRLLEVKACTPKHKNLNQVRPYKYIPLVVYMSEHQDPNGRWYVVAAHQLAAMATGRAGHHALDAFECVHLSVTKTWSQYEESREELGAACQRAFDRDDQFEELRELMQQVKADGIDRARRNRELAAAILARDATKNDGEDGTSFLSERRDDRISTTAPRTPAAGRGKAQVLDPFDIAGAVDADDG